MDCIEDEDTDVVQSRRFQMNAAAEDLFGVVACGVNPT